jgi:hypothetical protein
MNKYIIIICIIIFSVACKKETHSIAISINNNTGNTIYCTFYPTKPAKGLVYETAIDTGVIAEFANSNNMNLSPRKLLKKAVDSISIKTDLYSKTIVFKNGKVRNYKTNPYDDDYSWVLTKSTTSSTSSHDTYNNYVDNYIITINLQDTL